MLGCGGDVLFWSLNAATVAEVADCCEAYLSDLRATWWSMAEGILYVNHYLDQSSLVLQNS